MYFEDEAGVYSDYHRGTTWAVPGDTPIIRTTVARFSIANDISHNGKG